MERLSRSVPLIEDERATDSPSAAFPPPEKQWPQHDQDEISAVVGVLASGRVNSLVHGEQGRRFEQEFASYCGAPFAIGVANGTVALELAFHALGIGSGAEVIVPARSFFASASAVAAVGATPVFADIERDSQNIDPESVRRLITARTRAILCVHLAGWPCDMDQLAAIAERYELRLVEDCAQAHGAGYRGRRVGSFGDAAAFSFCTDKIMSTGGEGGMLLLKDEAHWARAWAYKDHGKDPVKVREPASGNAYRYIHDSFGTNMRLTEMQSAIGRAQLAKLPGWLARRRRNVAVLRDELRGHPLLELPPVPAHVDPASYKFYCFLAVDRLANGVTRSDIIGALRQRGIPASAGSCPDMSKERAVLTSAFPSRTPLPVAELVGERSLMLPCDHLLGESEMRFMAGVLKEALEPALGQ